MTMDVMLARIDRLFLDRGSDEYHGEAVTQLEHALQCGRLAEADDRPPCMIVAALLHDLGHLLHAQGEDALERSIDDRHELLAARFLAPAFGPEVTDPIRLHVPAKRYLAAVRPGYRELLSPASIRSLALQGGPMTPAEITAFELEPFGSAAAALRVYDDRAKVVGLATPPYAHFRSYLTAALRGG